MTLEEIQSELERIASSIEDAAVEIARAGQNATQLAADYEQLKQQCLVALYDDEAERKIKRTEAQRIAIYRTKYAVECRAHLMAKQEYDSCRTFLDALKSKAMILQTLAGIEKEKMRMV